VYGGIFTIHWSYYVLFNKRAGTPDKTQSASLFLKWLKKLLTLLKTKISRFKHKNGAKKK